MKFILTSLFIMFPFLLQGNTISELLNNASISSEKWYLRESPDSLDKLTDDELLERIQYDYTRACFKKDNDECITEIYGLRIGLLCVAAHNNWIDRDSAIECCLKYLRVFQRAQAVFGIMPRSFNRITGENTDKEYSCFGRPYDVVGTAFMAANLQFVIKPYFNANNNREKEIGKLCDSILSRIDWNFAYKKEEKCFTWFKNGAKANNFDGKHLIGEMDETFFLQLLVLGSKKWSYGTEAYENYLSNVFIDNQYGYKYYGTKEYNYKSSKQFSNHIIVRSQKSKEQKDYPMAKLGYLVQPHIWFDFRKIEDNFCAINELNYFESVQNAIRAQIKYSQLNPGKYPMYGDIWGFYDTYSPITNNWMVYGLPAEGDYDEGTISIDAIISSIVFCPEEALQCLRSLYKNFQTYGIYTQDGIITSINVPTGKVSPFFVDSFFPPINVMLLENYRSELIWNLASSTSQYKHILDKAGFHTKKI